MRTSVVSNFVTVDGYSESKDKTFTRFFDDFCVGYGDNGAIDDDNVELLRASDTADPGNPPPRE